MDDNSDRTETLLTSHHAVPMVSDVVNHSREVPPAVFSRRRKAGWRIGPRPAPRKPMPLAALEAAKHPHLREIVFTQRLW